jgi:YggT family protein
LASQRRLPGGVFLVYDTPAANERIAPVLLMTLLQIVDLLISVVTTIVIAQFVLYLLIVFNVVSVHGGFVSQLWNGLNAVLEPVLRPIRRIMPNTGTMDFSPLVLIVLLRISQIVIGNLAVASMT